MVEALAGPYRVIALGRSPEKLETVRSRFADFEPVVLDLGSPTDIAAALPAVDRLDGLVHCVVTVLESPADAQILEVSLRAASRPDAESGIAPGSRR